MVRANRKVSQVWLVVLLSFVMVITIMWHAYAAIEQIDADASYFVSTRIPGALEE